MKLTVIGCTGSMSGPHAPGSSYLIQEVDENGKEWSIVVDLGPGAFGNLWNYTSPQKIDALFFSHWHADHCSDALSMHVYRRWHPRITFDPLPVYSPGKGLERLRQLDGFSNDDTFDEFIFHDFRDCTGATAGTPVTVGPFRVTPYEALHTVPAVSLRIESSANSAVLTYTGDTDMCDGVRAAAKGADLLLS